MTDPSIQACVKYESTLDVTKMEKVKMELVTAAGTVRSKKTPVFSAKHGVEGLYHAIDRFNKNAAKLNYQAGDKWNNFDEALDTVAQSKWETQTTNIAANQRTNARFQLECDRFVASYAEGTDPRDKLIKYIKTCNKPFKKGNQEHSDRLEALINIANRLQGTEPDIDDQNRKKIIFETFPSGWQDDFHKSGKQVSTQQLYEIIAFMNICKKQADSDNERKTKKQKTERIRGGSNASSIKNHKNKDSCPWPGHGKGHTWEECSKNPASKNYAGNEPYVPRGGRGQGRGYGGRGGRGFGRGFGRGRSNYYGNGPSGRGYQYSGQGGRGQQGTGGSFNSQTNNKNQSENYFNHSQNNSSGNWNDMYHQEMNNHNNNQNYNYQNQNKQW